MEKIIEEFRLERPSLAQYTFEGLTTFLEDLAAHAAGVTNARHVLKRFEGKPVGDKLVCKSVSAAGKVAFATATGGTSVKSVHKDAAALVKLFQGAATPRRVLGAEKTPLGAGTAATLLRGAAKQPKRECVALIGTGWVHEVLRFKPKHPAVVLDIDDTLVDRQEKLNDGFQFMAEFFKDARMHGVSMHFVSARPESTRGEVLRLLNAACCGVDSRNLWLMTDRAYDSGDMDKVVSFKDASYKAIRRDHTVIARFGDRLWDIARPKVVGTKLSALDDRSCFVCVDSTHWCLSAKLPGS